MLSLKNAMLLTTLSTLPAGTAPVDRATPAPLASAQDPEPVQPPTPAPRTAPPPPPAERPNPPAEAPPAPTDRQDTTGQWVYTSQYGWVWMPYGDTYTHAPAGGATPQMYLYYPEAGWCWVLAPWLWGWGPMPYFGLVGPRLFGWYGIGLGHWYGWHGHFDHRGWYSRGHYAGGRWNDVGHGHYAAPGGRSVAGGRGTYHGGSARGGSSRGFSRGGHR